MKVFKNHVHFTDPDTNEATRYEPNDECPAKVAALIDPANLRDPKAEADEDEAQRKADKEGVINYKTLGKEDLIALCDDRKLDPSGTKQVLIERLEAHDAALR